MPGGVHPPLSVVLSWPKPNYDHPHSRGDGIVVVCLFFAITTTVLVSLRLYSRICLIHQPGLDDVLVVLGLIFAILLTVLVLVAYYHFGVGIHVWDVHPTKFATARFVTWLSQFCAVLSISFTKISILLFYRRLANGSYTKGFLWGVWVGILYNIAYGIGFVIYVAFMCNPPDAYWQQFSSTYQKKWKCANEHISLPLSGALSIIGDLYATVLPALLLRNLQMPRKQKILLYALFATGFLVVGAGIVRTVYMNRVINQTYDTTWALWTVWIWTVVETDLAMMCACGPALKPLYVEYMVPSIHEAYGYARSKQSQYTSNKSNRSRTSQSYASKKAFATISHQSQHSTSYITSDGGTRQKGAEMKIVVRSDIEQVEERSSRNSILNARPRAVDGDLPLRDQGGGRAI